MRNWDSFSESKQLDELLRRNVKVLEEEKGYVLMPSITSINDKTAVPELSTESRYPVLAYPR